MFEGTANDLVQLLGVEGHCMCLTVEQPTA